MWAQANRAFVLPLLGALVALAWLVLWVWGQSPYARFLSHHNLGEPRGGLVVVFIAGWAMMIVAMMLPTSLPLMASFHALTLRRPDRGTLLALTPRYRLKRDQAMDLLWPNLVMRAASKNLRQALYASLRTIDPRSDDLLLYLALQEGQLVLCPIGSLWVDFEAFEATTRPHALA